eukprot:CAMPEP_0176451440 /NCGR_PEP_ID=MMETSP0127-20121128/27839_1 /TAXON_ID=938130 /ORGANISM="Platyophrya macrostoma, Strain WH" /LENGTH=174 /DNA_ID=CAMNT_0017839499 /DNA_START=44 /DNA_END=568 /DNA_ORIENTATION=+
MNDLTIKIQTKDGKEFKVTDKITQFSKFIATTVEDSNMVDDHIPMDISSELLQKILEFFQHFTYDLSKVKTIQKPLTSSNYAHITDEWCEGFFKSLTEDQVNEIIMAGSYLQSPVLFDYSCAYLACPFKTISIDELRQKYDIAEELTPEIEEQIKKDYPYLFKDLLPQQTGNDK